MYVHASNQSCLHAKKTQLHLHRSDQTILTGKNELRVVSKKLLRESGHCQGPRAPASALALAFELSMWVEKIGPQWAAWSTSSSHLTVCEQGLLRSSSSGGASDYGLRVRRGALWPTAIDTTGPSVASPIGGNGQTSLYPTGTSSTYGGR